jgi:hypothetical protein
MKVLRKWLLKTEDLHHRAVRTFDLRDDELTALYTYIYNKMQL